MDTQEERRHLTASPLHNHFTIDQMSLTHYLFNDSCSGLGSFDRFDDDAFHPQAMLRVQDKDNFRPR